MKDTANWSVILFALEATILLCSILSARFARALAKLLSIHAEAWENALATYRIVWRERTSVDSAEQVRRRLLASTWE